MEYPQPFEELRAAIDRLDNSLIDILAQRFRLTDEIGALKKQYKLPPVDKNREIAQAARVKELAALYGLREDIALKVLRTIIDEVVLNHQMI